MLRSITLKTVFEKRWSLLAWYVGLFATTVLIMLIFPTFRDTLGKALSNVPDSIKPILGDAQTYQHINGFIDVQVLAQMVFMTIVYGVILFSGVIAGDENEGTLQTLLSHPVSRTQVYFEKFLGASILLAVVNSSVYIGTWAGAVIVGQHLNLFRLALACGMLYLVTLAFSAIGFSLGAITGKRGMAGAAAGSLAFASYIVTNLAPSVKQLKTINKFSPYRYFNKPSIMDYGVRGMDFAILLGITIAFVGLGYILFNKRDIAHR